MPKYKVNKQHLQVILGSQTIKAFVAAPKEFNVIGIVRMGRDANSCLEFGLLAITEAGTYFRVNGSTVAALNSDAVKAAIRATITHGRGRPYIDKCSHQAVTAAPAPTIIVRKRRRIVALGQLRSDPEMALPS